MATTTRQPKQARNKPMQDAGRRPPAWTGSRGSSTFSPATPPPGRGPTAQAQPQQNSSGAGAFPPLGGGSTNGTNPNANANAPDKTLASLAGLTGTTVTVSTRTGQRYEGVVFSTAGEGDTTGLTLKDARDVSTPGAPLKDRQFVAATNIANWSSGPADARPAAPNGNAADSFKTDVDITAKFGLGPGRARERELQAWADDSAGLDLTSSMMGSPAATAGHGDDVTFGSGAGSGGGWDQFATNERLFGVRTGFDEDAYTTKLDRSAPDFKERERKAQQIANEIMGATVNNPHIAEERVMNNADDSGVNEEDKYGAVVRGANAYVPPGARKSGTSATPTPAAPAAPIQALAPAVTVAPPVPKLSVNGPDGNAQPVPAPAASSSSTTKTPADLPNAFRDFVSTEKQRLTQKRQMLVKSEKDKKMAELLEFSQKFKLKQPIPEDLVPILAKDEQKQQAIREKASKDASSAAARAIATPAQQAAAAAAAAAISPTPSAMNVNPVKLDVSRAKAGITASATTKTISTSGAGASGSTKSAATDKKGRQAMVIQAIPAFKGKKAVSPAPNAAQGEAPPLSPDSARLNVNALSFKPNPKAVAFSPVGGPSPKQSGSASESPKPKNEQPATPAQPNPFFGTRVVKKTPPVSIRDDFNPFKYNKVAEASAVGANWPFNGKRYMQMFPPIPQPPPQPIQASPLMAPPQPVQMPPQQQPQPPVGYEEDPARAAAAAGGYVYAYPPYGYPGAPMMQGMPPPGPPGPYMASPYMQPMHYPPPMAPNGPPMYASPQVGQMPLHPAPGTYMAPPPGPYPPPPPNAAGPRPSPIPGHAHAYYQPSPQMQHAVPYQMMMPGPPPGPNMQQHPYEQGPPPPAPMGAAGHA